MATTTTNNFTHDSNARHDEKIINLRMRHGAAGYGVFFMILERLREENNYMSVKDYNMIAFDLRVDAAMVKSVVEDFGLFVFTDDGKYFYSESFNRRMNANDTPHMSRAEIGKIGAQKRWSKTKKQDAACEDKPAKQSPAPSPAPAPQTEQGHSDGKADNRACLKRFFGPTNQANLETLLMNFGLKPGDMPLLRNAAKDVVAEWELQERQHCSYTDWSQHLISVMRIKVKEQKTKGPASQAPPSAADYSYEGGFGSKDV